jgi:hypothetical protein
MNEQFLFIIRTRTGLEIKPGNTQLFCYKILKSFKNYSTVSPLSKDHCRQVWTKLKKCNE